MRFRVRNGKKICLHAVLILAAVAQAGSAADAPPLIHIRNFGQVNDHLYRGGEPSEEGLRDLSKMHIVLDIDLREAGAATETERRMAEALGIHYVNVPMRGLTAPTFQQVERVLALIVPDDAGKAFVHCRRGKDRTGTVIACYRVEHDGWDNRRAQEEANSYGMSWTERGMRGFVLKFKPVDLPAAKSAQ